MPVGHCPAPPGPPPGWGFISVGFHLRLLTGLPFGQPGATRSKCSAGPLCGSPRASSLFNPWRLVKIFCLSLFEKRTQKGMERPQGYKSKPTLHLKPCGLFHLLVRHCASGRPALIRNEVEEPQG